MAQKVSVDMAGGCENTDFWMRADVVALPPQQGYHGNLCLLGSQHMLPTGSVPIRNISLLKLALPSAREQGQLLFDFSLEH